MKKFLKNICIFIICILVSLILVIRSIYIDKSEHLNYNNLVQDINKIEEIYNATNEENVKNEVILLNINNPIKVKQSLNDWRLILVNYEHELPENFNIKLANIDNTRQFDERAIDELNALLIDAKKAKIGNLWVQSAYRSIERQEELFNKKMNEYIRAGKSKEEADMLTRKYINESNTSEHNIGLAVDFNYINKDFEKTPVFAWLMENAEKYGFILRYRKDKEEITRVNYEPWHWRYVGVEHAEKINELDMCLEEYVDFLENGED